MKDDVEAKQLTAALIANVEGKAEVIEQLWRDLSQSKALNRALLQSCHKMHESYGKPNFN